MRKTDPVALTFFVILIAFIIVGYSCRGPADSVAEAQIPITLSNMEVVDRGLLQIGTERFTAYDILDRERGRICTLYEPNVRPYGNTDFDHFVTYHWDCRDLPQ